MRGAPKSLNVPKEESPSSSTNFFAQFDAGPEASAPTADKTPENYFAQFDDSTADTAATIQRIGDSEPKPRNFFAQFDNGGVLPPQEKTLGPGQSMQNAYRRGLLGPVAAGVEWGGDALSATAQMVANLLTASDATIDDPRGPTNPYIAAADRYGQMTSKIGQVGRAAVNVINPRDPNRPITEAVGGTVGNLAPVIGATAVGGPEAGAAVGAGIFGSQNYAGAIDQGATPADAALTGVGGLELGAMLPFSNIMRGAAPLVGRTWGQLAYGTALNASKAYFEGLGLNTASAEATNVVVPQAQPQKQLLWDSIEGSLPLAFVGGLAHGVEQTGAEMAVSQAAKEAGQAKSALIVNTAKSFDAIANDPAKSPDQKMQDVMGFFAPFSPGAQKAIMAHVQNVGTTVDAIGAAAEQAKALAPTNPQTAVALQKEQTDAAVANMQTTATTIDQEAEEAEKRAQEAFPEEKEPEPAAEDQKAAAPAVTLPDHLEGPIAEAEKRMAAGDVEGANAVLWRAQDVMPYTGEAPPAGWDEAPEAWPAQRARNQAIVDAAMARTKPIEDAIAAAKAKPAAPEEQPVVQSPIPGGMTSDEYGALARHMENSPDPDVQARARELLQLRQQALQEHASTDSDARKTELEGEILAHEAALRKLSEEPQKEAPPATPAAEPEAVQAPQTVVGYDEYSNPVYAETPPAAEEKPAAAQSTPEATPVAESPQPEQGGVPAAAGTAGVAEQHPAETSSEPAGEKFVAPPLEGLKRPALEKLAKEEGHHPDDIKAAKSVKDLRKMIEDLREARHVVGDTETPEDKLEGGGMAADNAEVHVDPKIKNLPAKYRKAVESFIKAAKSGKTWGTTKFVLSAHQPGGGTSPTWANPRIGSFDTVYIHPWRLHEIGADTPLNKKLFQEERLHNQAGYILNQRWIKAGKPGTFTEFYDKNFQAVHDQMSKTQRNQLQENYGVAGMHPVNIGEEYFRQTMQKAMGENLTEDEYNELAKRLRNNRPLRNIVQAVKERLTAMVQKLTSHGVKDDDLTFAEQKLDELIGGKKEAEPSEEAKGEPTASGAPPRTEGDESKLWLSGDEGVREAPVITPMKSPKQMAEYKPFVEEGQAAGELKPTGAEKLRSQRAVPAEAQEREQTIANRIRSLAHVDIPADKQQEFLDRVQKLARNPTMHYFSGDAARDLAESNAFVKVMIEAKKWQEQYGNLDGFGSRRIIQNSLLDDGRRAAHTELSGTPKAEETEEPETSTEGESGPQPKGYDASAQDYEEQQSQFEPVGQDSSQLATTETPAKRAQAAEVERNRQAIMDRISPYGRRLLELWRDTPHDPSAAFAPWVSKAAKELGLPRAKIMADFDAITTGLRREISQRGLTKEDLIHAPGASGAPPMRREGFAEQGTNDDRLSENLKSILQSRTYEQNQNEADAAEAKTWVDAHDESTAFSHLMDAAKTGRPTPVDVFAAMSLIRKWDAAPEEDGVSHLRSAELYTAMSSRATEAGKFTQPFRQWSKLGANGVLEAYKKIITPAIEGAKEPFSKTIEAIRDLIKNGKLQAADEALDRLDKSGVTAKVDRAAAIAQEEAKPIWQRYMDATAATLSRLRMEASSPKVQGALEEFASRLKTNLTGLMREMLPKAKGAAPEKMSATAKLGEVYKNMPEYQQAWDHARDFIKLKYADDPDTLQQFEMAMNKAFEAPVKLTDKALDEQMKASGISLRDVAKQWADSQNATRDSLIKAITDKMGLTPEQAKAAGDAIASRFQERLEAAKKNEVAKLLKQSGQNRLANAAPAVSDKIFKALNLGAADSDVIWNAVAEKYGLPKYDKAMAQDLMRRAAEIQKLRDAGHEKLVDDKTQDMMNILANEAQKNMSYLRQVGEGEMAIFYGNIFGPQTVGRKSYSEVLNLIGDVGLMGLVQMRHGDALAVPRAYLAALRGLYQRGGADFRSIMMTGRGMRQFDGDYTANNLVERGKVFGNVPVLSKLNTPLSMVYKPVGRILYGAQAFFYAGASEARANMIAYRAAKQLIREGKAPDDISVNRLTQEILGNSPEMRQSFAEQAQEEGLTGRAAILRAQELAEQSRPDEIRQAAHDFASRTTFMQDPEGVLGKLQKQLTDFQRIRPDDDLSIKAAKVASRLAVPVTRVVTNVFNNYQAYSPLGLFGAARFAKAGDADMAYMQMAKVTAGTLGTLALATMFGPNIQGAGPKDYEKRRQLISEGWLPYSIKIGDNYYSYREWPVALMMAGIGSYYDQGKHGENPPDLTSRLALSLLATGRFATTSSWIASVSGALDSIGASGYQNPQKAFYNALGLTAGALVPFNQSALKVIDKIFDPQLYPPNSVAGALASQVTVARRFDNSGLPMLNALGDPVESNPISAFFSSCTHDPIWRTMADKDIFIPVATKAERVNGRPITNEELYALTRDAGQATKEQLLEGNLDAMAGMDQEQAQARLSAIYRGNIDKVKATLAAAAIQAGEVPTPKAKSQRRH
jgi:hypothetical protein